MKRWPFLLIGIFLFKADAFALNVKDLIARSRQLIGDTAYYTPMPKLSDQRIMDYLNEGHRYAAATGNFLVQRATFGLTAGTTEYFLPADYLTAKRVFWGTKLLYETTLDDLDYNSGDWQSASGDPGRYYTRTTTMTVMGFYPAPDSTSATSTGTVSLDYQAQPNTLDSLDDIPFLGIYDLYPLHETLPKFVAYRYYLLLGNKDAADIFAKEFLTDVQTLKKILESKPNYKPGFSGMR